jgi:transposase-like protein
LTTDLAMANEDEDILDLIPLDQEEREIVKADQGEWQLDLNDLYAPNGKYSPEEKLYAVVCFMVEGNSIAAGKRSGINPATIRWWKTESTWWDDAMKEARRRYQDALDGKLTKVVHEGADAILERIENGDEVITKDGDIERKRLGARDLAIIVGTMYDKRALLRGDPTSNPGGKNTSLENLAKQFENFAHKLEQSGNLAKPIEGKVISGDDLIQGEE